MTKQVLPDVLMVAAVAKRSSKKLALFVKIKEITIRVKGRMHKTTLLKELTGKLLSLL